MNARWPATRRALRLQLTSDTRSLLLMAAVWVSPWPAAIVIHAVAR